MSNEINGVKRKINEETNQTSEFITKVLKIEEHRNAIALKNGSGSSNQKVTDVMDKTDCIYDSEEDTKESEEDPDNSRNSCGGSTSGSVESREFIALTKKFIQHVHTGRGGAIDLNSTAEQLNANSKDTFFDIADILEGVGLLEKKSMNLLNWKGNSWIPKQGPKWDGKINEREHVIKLQNEIVKLDEKEKELDDYLFWARQSIKNVCEGGSIAKLNYMTPQDFNRIYDDKTVLIVKGPRGTVFNQGTTQKKNDKNVYPLKIYSEFLPMNVIHINKKPVESETNFEHDDELPPETSQFYYEDNETEFFVNDNPQQEYQEDYQDGSYSFSANGEVVQVLGQEHHINYEEDNHFNGDSIYPENVVPIQNEVPLITETLTESIMNQTPDNFYHFTTFLEPLPKPRDYIFGFHDTSSQIFRTDM
uniref:E2F_TDP domain-containing protein n=1 Tax=Rhabditophanes sp. KR3021 TaxID=114890 RepID=A0AC35UIA5_9BILA